jgi:hypothetical protein
MLAGVLPWLLLAASLLLFVWRARVHARHVRALRRACWVLAEVDEIMGPPYYNHTRADGPYDPCPECRLRAAVRDVLERNRMVHPDPELDAVMSGRPQGPPS